MDSLSVGSQLVVVLLMKKMDAKDEGRIPDSSVEPRLYPSCPSRIVVQPFHSHFGVHALVWR
jgi:hypothetical protein